MLTYEFIDPETQIANEDFAFVESFLRSTQRNQLGWHYITDIVWMYSRIKHWPRTFKVLDAGGGNGPVQFFLAELGFNVTNIDMALPEPPFANRGRYRMERRILPSFKPTEYKSFLDAHFNVGGLKNRLANWIRQSAFYRAMKAKRYARMHDAWRKQAGLSSQPLGRIEWLVGNLCEMPEIHDASFDAVVSLSAWEHIPSEFLGPALKEIRRTLKPEAQWAVTTSGTEQAKTWWHEPSQCWCFTVEDFESRFEAKAAFPHDPAAVMNRYKQCRYLQENLSTFYKSSGNNGMPWGVWDPKYIPVGLGT